MTPIASERVRDEWLRRVEAEYRSASLTQHLTLWLIQMGASPDLIKVGLRIVRDELAHAEKSYRIFSLAGGQGGPTLVREQLALDRDARRSLESSVAHVAAEMFCLGETVAVPLFARMLRGCVVPEARRVIERIVRDEVRHRDFGFLLLGWMFSLPDGEALREELRAALPVMMASYRAQYGRGEAAGEWAPTAEERAWGLIGAGEYAEVLERAVERDFQPRFTELGLDVRAAWRLSAP